MEIYSCASEMEFHRAKRNTGEYEPITDVVCQSWEKNLHGYEFDDGSQLIVFRNGDLEWHSNDGTRGAHLLRSENGVQRAA